MTNVTVLGFADLEKNIKALKKESDDQVVTAVKLVAEIIKDAMVDKAPRRTGALAQSILAVESDVSKGGGSYAMDIGPARFPAFYAHFVEFGTGPSQISGDALKLGENSYRDSVSHPGSPAQPFIRPAYDENIDTGIQTAGEQIKRGLL